MQGFSYGIKNQEKLRKTGHPQKKSAKSLFSLGSNCGCPNYFSIVRYHHKSLTTKYLKLLIGTAKPDCCGIRAEN
jgi:hypothetical protein